MASQPKLSFKDPTSKVSPSFMTVVGRICKAPDSWPLLAMLGIAGTAMMSYVAYQFRYRPDFKCIRTKSNRTAEIDKEITHFSQRIIRMGRYKDDTPDVVKKLYKELPHDS